MDKTNLPMIGKDVLESLTMSMYDDSVSIYREYIQNSADAIDKAVSQDILKKNDHSIHINIDGEQRSILIEDNAIGISQQEFKSTLQNVAVSRKTKGTDKGFRGIGRLGGVGYCDTLTFETSFKGESAKSVMVWNAKEFREKINDHEQKEHAAIVIDQITNTYTEVANADDHYFRVIMQNVTSNELLDRKNVELYLSMVAPVPYPVGFVFRSKIYDELKKEGLSIDEYKIFINGDLITKPYTSSIYSDGKGRKEKYDDVFDLQFFKEKDEHGNLLYWGWYSLSTFQKVIELSCNPARGIRLRKDNIQIGSEITLKKLHREERGNSYFFGEVHAFHKNLIPIARRDYFIENKTLDQFEKKLRNLFHCNLHKIYYDASKIRTANRDIHQYQEAKDALKQKEKSGFHSNDEKDQLFENERLARIKAEEAKRKLDQFENNNPDVAVSKILARIKLSNGDYNDILKGDEEVNTVNEKDSNNEKTKTPFFTDKYPWLPKSERKLLSKVFSVISNVLPKDVAKNLIDKIDEEIAAKK